MPIILVENERTAGGLYDHWQDLTGQRYQYPNQYKNKVSPGELFIYYKGTRRADGSRGPAHYFGCGVVGDIELDQNIDESTPKKNWKWVCSIEDYVEFTNPVPAIIDGKGTYEDIPKNFWSVAVRNISTEKYNKIVSAGIDEQFVNELENAGCQPSLVDTNLFNVPRNRGHRGRLGKRSIRRSRRSKQIGDLGERLVFDYLSSTLHGKSLETLRWLARDGKTPGWDIEYKDGNDYIAIEVKSTVERKFPSIELTDNEWNAARRLGEKYQLWLVAEVESSSPKMHVISDLSLRVKDGLMTADPMRWEIRMAPQRVDALDTSGTGNLNH